jgi:hypothetical protein
MYLVSIYDQSIIKASIVNHSFKEIKSVLHSRITIHSPYGRKAKSLLVSETCRSNGLYEGKEE